MENVAQNGGKNFKTVAKSVLLAEERQKSVILFDITEDERENEWGTLHEFMTSWRQHATLLSLVFEDAVGSDY